MENALKAQTAVQKSPFYSTGDQSYKKKSFIFQLLVGVGVSIQISWLTVASQIVKSLSLCYKSLIF